jgi:hypothetical protein
MSKHGYIYVVPKIDFQIAGQSIDSASKIRQMYTTADDATRLQIIKDLYPLAKAPKRIKRILDSVLGGLTEADNPNYFGGSSISPIPGTPQSLRVLPKEELKKQRKQEREDRILRKFMGRSHH